MPLNVGEMTEELTILTPTNTSDGQGGQTTTWATLASGVWATVMQSSGAEALQVGAVQAVQRYTFEIRRRDLTPTMRIQWTPYQGSQLTMQISAIDQTDPEKTVLSCAVVL